MSRADGGPPSAIVAIGASAGGFEALTQVLEHLDPHPNIAIVLIQHLSPQHSSALPELLGSKTSLPVLQVEDGMRIERDRIYVIPPAKHMGVADGRLQLRERPTDRSQFTPVDFFFKSLARWAEERSIAVVLSGTGSDGAAGVREIKALGGITIAQRPETARHGGMPTAAIATGLIDLVLSPIEIGENLGHVRWHPYLLPPEQREGAEESLTGAHLREVFAVLRRVSGIDFKQYKTPTVRRRLLRRMSLLRLTDLNAYVHHLIEHPAEARALSQDLLIHVTRFFRDPESFGALATHVFEPMLNDRGDDPIRIWIPGCSTGEEAYSVAICLLERFGDRVAGRRVQIFATDVSDAAVDRARAGVYAPSIAADVTADRLKRFFVRAENGYRISKTLRDMCVFARHDLTRDPPFARLDLIVCRNVMIYLDVPLQKRLMALFHYALRTRGALMLGAAETVGVGDNLFTMVDKKWRIFQKTGTVAMASAALQQEAAVALASVGKTEQDRRPPVEGRSIQDDVTRLILERYAPPGVVVDSTNQIVQFRGHTGRFLESAAGEPSLDVLKMVRNGLLHPLRTALHTARRHNRTVRKENVSIERSDGWGTCNMHVAPLASSRGHHCLVVFQEVPSPARDKKPGAAGRQRAQERRASSSQLNDVRKELTSTREYLQSIIQELEAANEELQSANEEILSSNEELQSTNEELDTAKEELQSTNEELNTVNDELHARNEELTRANSDLTNLLGSVDIPIVIVGSGLEIRRFTPKAEQLFNLLPGDVGRPIGQINPNFNAKGLDALIRQTIELVAPQEHEIQDKNGRWHAIRVRPYRSVDNRLDGAVIAIVDVDVAKRFDNAPRAATRAAPKGDDA